MKIIDLTHELNDDIREYPGDSKFQIRKIKEFNKDGYELSDVVTNMHIGTHVDVARHLSNNKKYLSDYSLETFIGNAVVLDFKDCVEIDWKDEFDEIVQNEDIVLIYTGFDRFFNEEKYYHDYPIVSLEFAKQIVKKKVKVLGIDMPSPDYYPFKIHQFLFEKDIPIVENLTGLERLIGAKFITFYGVPIKIRGEAGIMRAFALKNE
ncbi:MAG: cyclase family protein [Acholeplasma sp.]|nr:cyclase family protein [Acholeplasma sp.]